MHSKAASGKASKGTVQIINSHERLQLRFRYGGRRHYISLGVSDTATNRKLAEMKAREIELDILSGHFDETLVKYKPHSALTTAAPDITPTVTPTPSLKELWEKFVDYKRPQCSPNTMYYVYGHFTTYLEKLPTHALSEAVTIRDFALKTFPIESCRRFIVRLSACCDWAVRSGLTSDNPFVGMAAEIKPPKSQRKSSEDEDIQPFSPCERDAILQAVAANTFCNKHSGFKHSFYCPFLEFLFMTGCRPSEKIALQWKHISHDLRSVNYTR